MLLRMTGPSAGGDDCAGLVTRSKSRLAAGKSKRRWLRRQLASRATTKPERVDYKLPVTRALTMQGPVEDAALGDKWITSMGAVARSANDGNIWIRARIIGSYSWREGSLSS